MVSSRNLKAIVISIFIILFIISIPNRSFATSKSVKVTLPNFKVTLNGTVVENNYKEYPLIVYNNITYFPMTYYDCRFLGLETDWDGSKLSIEKDNISGAYYDYKTTKKNNTSNIATIPSFPIKVNGKTIDNSKETYPLLSFRSVTYFPLTWKYGVGEFGWDYNFSNDKGLVINADTLTPKEVVIQNDLGGGFTVSDGYLYYYDGNNGKIMAANLNNPANLIEVHKLEKIKFLDQIQYPGYNIYEKNGEGYFSIATQDNPPKFQLYKVNGKTKKLEKADSGTDTFGDISVIVENSDGSKLNNLFVQKNGSDKKNIGNPNFHYMQTSGGNWGERVGRVFLSGDEVVLIADDGNESEGYELCKVNINTGKHTTLLKGIYICDFKVDNGYAYIIQSNEDTDKLKKVNIADGTVNEIQTIEENSLKSEVFEVKNGHIFYQNGFDLGRPPLHVGPSTPEYEAEFNEWAKRIIPDQSLYKVGNKQSFNVGAVVRDLSIQGDYILCTFDEENSKGKPSKYGLMVFDKNGKTVFKTADKVGLTYIDGNTLVYSRYDNIDTTYKTCKVYVVEL